MTLSCLCAPKSHSGAATNEIDAKQLASLFDLGLGVTRYDARDTRERFALSGVPESLLGRFKTQLRAVRPPTCCSTTKVTSMGEPTKEERKALKKARKKAAREKKQEAETAVQVKAEAPKSKKKRKAEEAAAAAATAATEGNSQDQPSPSATKVGWAPRKIQAGKHRADVGYQQPRPSSGSA